MKKVFKVIGKILLGILILMLLVLACTFTYNQIMLKKEAALWQNPPGQYVTVGGHKMHIYTEGEGDHTIVLLSGWGDTSPYVNFLPLCQDLSTDAKVVILERFGYGFSDAVEGERTFDTILEEDREGLKQAGINGPFVLCPHSIAGLEATLWAQKYPAEVEGIVGMDITVPGVDESLEKGAKEMKKILKTQLPLMNFLSKSGIYRIMAGTTDDELEKIHAAIDYRSILNKTKINEFYHDIDTCHEILNNPLPTAPTIQYVAKQNIESTPGWLEAHQALVDASSNGKLVQLDCSHYVYRDEGERIAKEIKEFLKTLN
ncbi:MAG: alpha/beta hydrolase [Butyrivibrio sp.]|nr:alpha/beta hydrolase [Butyrivibrio sp.]